MILLDDAGTALEKQSHRLHSFRAYGAVQNRFDHLLTDVIEFGAIVQQRGCDVPAVAKRREVKRRVTSDETLVVDVGAPPYQVFHAVDSVAQRRGQDGVHAGTRLYVVMARAGILQLRQKVQQAAIGRPDIIEEEGLVGRRRHTGIDLDPLSIGLRCRSYVIDRDLSRRTILRRVRGSQGSIGGG